MSGNIRRWLVGTFLLGALAFVGAPRAQAQYPNYPQDRRDDDRRDRDRDRDDYRRGSRGDYRDDQRQLRFLEEQIQRDKEDIRLESRRHGGRSYQVRAARERLKRDERALKDLKKDMKRDRKLNRNRYNGSVWDPWLRRR